MRSRGFRELPMFPCLKGRNQDTKKEEKRVVGFCSTHHHSVFFFDSYKITRLQEFRLLCLCFAYDRKSPKQKKSPLLVFLSLLLILVSVPPVQYLKYWILLLIYAFARIKFRYATLHHRRSLFYIVSLSLSVSLPTVNLHDNTCSGSKSSTSLRPFIPLGTLPYIPLRLPPTTLYTTPVTVHCSLSCMPLACCLSYHKPPLHYPPSTLCFLTFKRASSLYNVGCLLASSSGPLSSSIV